MATIWTCKSLVQRFCQSQAIRQPPNVVTSTDEGVLQMLGLLNDLLFDLQQRDDWRGLHQPVTFQHAGLANYLALDLRPSSTQLGNGMTVQFLINQTLWCTTQKIPVAGPIPDSDWDAMIAQAIEPALFSYRIAGFGLQIYPAPSVLAGTDFTVEIYSRETVLAANGTTWKDQFTSDDDVPQLPGSLLLAGLRYMWRMEKGLAYAEHQRTFETQLQTIISRDGQAPEIKLDADKLYPNVASPGLLIPAGNWNV